MVIAKANDLSIVNVPFDEREIRYVFHDIDGTHSLIRDWPPVMSVVLNDVIENGLILNFDGEENIKRLIKKTGEKPLEETDRFCVESAGLSALTQMEWAIRRAAQNGKIKLSFDEEDNNRKIQCIWQGTEVFDTPDTPEFAQYISQNTPRLFKCYEQVLNGYCRDKNLVLARKNPEKFQVAGSLKWMKFLKENGVKNYFVTGAVVERGMGMYEEVEALGYTIGENGVADNIFGSTWDEKLPKNVIMQRLVENLGASPENILIVGDGRSEISAGVQMGALTLSRLSKDAGRQIKIHKDLGTNMIVSDYLDAALSKNLFAF